MSIKLWGYNVNTTYLNDSELNYLSSLPKEKPDVEWLWKEMDRVWFQYNLNNKISLDKQPIDEFYSHPVWIANGIFTAIDPESVEHRKAICNYLFQNSVKFIADYGGGSGVLANILTQKIDLYVDIVEPYPSKFFVNHYEDNNRIRYVESFKRDDYDAAIAQDVLEHIENPIETAYSISCNLKQDGYVIFANCFFPVIQCHLPNTFYLRRSFPLVMQAMGLKFIGSIHQAPHALVFQKKGKLSLSKARTAAAVARLISPSVEIAAKIWRKLR